MDAYSIAPSPAALWTNLGENGITRLSSYHINMFICYSAVKCFSSTDLLGAEWKGQSSQLLIHTVIGKKRFIQSLKNMIHTVIGKTRFIQSLEKHDSHSHWKKRKRKKNNQQQQQNQQQKTTNKRFTQSLEKHDSYSH